MRVIVTVPPVAAAESWVPLLGFLAIDATLEGTEVVSKNGAFGGTPVVFLGALLAYLVLERADAWMRRHQDLSTAARPAALPPRPLALLSASGCTTSADASPSDRATVWARGRRVRSGRSSVRC